MSLEAVTLFCFNYGARWGVLRVCRAAGADVTDYCGFGCTCDGVDPLAPSATAAVLQPNPVVAGPIAWRVISGGKKRFRALNAVAIGPLELPRNVTANR